MCSTVTSASPFRRIFVTLIVAPLVAAALAQDAAPGGAGTIELADAGFLGPESMLHDEQADVYLVSNVNGAPSEADGNGFISRVSPDGEVLELRWIDGEADGVELDAPKGMALAGNTLYVADITNVRMFDRESGEQTSSVAIPDTTFLNDAAPAEDGGVFVTDTAVGPDFQPAGTAAVYHVSEDGTVRQVIASPDLGGPNGVLATGPNSLVVVTFDTPGRIIRIDDGEISESQEMSAGGFDGVLALPDSDDLLVSSWSASAVLRVEPDGSSTAVVEGVEGPADIGYDANRQQLLIPQLQGNTVLIVPLGEAQQQ
ncbi:MAG: SMP-30/gluconolactonase/LRE family protein [Trueperaceae bacterium]